MRYSKKVCSIHRGDKTVDKGSLFEEPQKLHLWDKNLNVIF